MTTEQSLRPLTIGETALVLDHDEEEPALLPVMLTAPDTLWLQRDDGELTAIAPALVVPGAYIAAITGLDGATGDTLYRIALTHDAPRQAIARRWLTLVDLVDLTLGQPHRRNPQMWLNLRGHTPDGLSAALAVPFHRHTETEAAAFLLAHISRDQNRILQRLLHGPAL